MNLKKFSKQEWDKYSESAHLICFSERLDAQFNDYTFCLTVEAEDGTPLMYSTILDLHDGDCYMKHGGAFPSSKGTPLSYKCYLKIMDYLKSNYKRISTLIENENTPMLKFAMSVGFKITGLRIIDNKILLEHTLIAEEK